MVEVGAMSEVTTDQLFLALRLAALEQSVPAGVVLPFLADDLSVNFDDERAEAGTQRVFPMTRAFYMLTRLGKLIASDWIGLGKTLRRGRRERRPG